MMGSGGLVVLDETDCMVEVARYFMAFTQGESCGKCTCCRVGTHRMLELLTRLCAGEGRPGDLERLEELGRIVRDGSLCGLGRSAPNPVLSTLRYFRSEYEAHLEGRCPAGRCKALIAYTITDECIGCTRCAQSCPAQAIAPRPYEQHRIDAARCIRCGTCRQVCPSEAVRVVPRAELPVGEAAAGAPAAVASPRGEAARA
jgi:NADH-quinone oxidoreductase subunit F